MADGVKVWDTLAIGEYLREIKPKAGPLPADRAARAHCRAICGEMHSGFASMRWLMPLNIKAHLPKFKTRPRAEADVQRITQIWDECLAQYGGPFLFGAKPCMAGAMYASVVSRFKTYDIALNEACVAYCVRVWTLPAVQQWVAASLLEDEDEDKLDAEF